MQIRIYSLRHTSIRSALKLGYRLRRESTIRLQRLVASEGGRQTNEDLVHGARWEPWWIPWGTAMVRYGALKINGCPAYTWYIMLHHGTSWYPAILENDKFLRSQ